MHSPEPSRPRQRGLVLGRLPPGPLNAITDVPGVRVGQVTLSSGPNPTVRTGVTAIVPADGNVFRDKVSAACHVINGFGKAAGLSQIAELGELETPIALTNTLCVGAGMLGLVKYTLGLNPGIRSVNAVVAECNDGWLNDIAALTVRPEHVLQAIAEARGGPVAEGAVGAGTGMMCYEWKGGIGTASRLTAAGDGGQYVLGALVLTNFGHAEDLRIDGAPIGAVLRPPERIDHTAGQSGSCAVVLATSAPADARQLARVARRAQTGLARTGTYGEHGSGEYAIAFSTVRRGGRVSAAGRSAALDEGGVEMNALFQAVVEATEEAVVNSLFAATTLEGRLGRRGVALPVTRALHLIEATRHTGS